MSSLPSVEQRIQTEGAVTRSPVSESLVQTIGSSTNYLLDKADAQDTYNATNTSNISNIFAQLAVAAKFYSQGFSYTGSSGTVLTLPGSGTIQAGFIAFGVGTNQVLVFSMGPSGSTNITFGGVVYTLSNSGTTISLSTSASLPTTTGQSGAIYF